MFWLYFVLGLFVLLILFKGFFSKRDEDINGSKEVPIRSNRSTHHKLKLHRSKNKETKNEAVATSK